MYKPNKPTGFYGAKNKNKRHIEDTESRNNV